MDEGELFKICRSLISMLNTVYHTAASCWHEDTGVRGLIALPSTDMVYLYGAPKQCTLYLYSAIGAFLIL
eukprot:2017805-Ditylum_brightwellii.AAC.2